MSEPRSGVLAVGNWIQDTTKVVVEWPEQDNLTHILSEETCNGGGAYNLLVDLACLGADFPLAGGGRIGKDAAGQKIREDCASRSIDTSLLKLDPDHPTSYTDVMTVKGTGRRTFFHQKGANAAFSPSDLDLKSRAEKIFYFGYILLLDEMDRSVDESHTGASLVLESAKKEGFITVADTVSVPSQEFSKIVRASLPYIDYLVVNEKEAGWVIGMDLEASNPGDHSVIEASEKLLEMGVGRAVVIHQTSGATYAGRDGEVAVQGSVLIPQSEIRGAVGAGDAFAAGFVLGLHNEASPGECLIQGVCAAAACLQHETTSAGMRPLQDCLALGEKWGFRSVGSTRVPPQLG